MVRLRNSLSPLIRRATVRRIRFSNVLFACFACLALNNTIVLSAYAAPQTSGCFDEKRFCITLVNSVSVPNYYDVTAKRHLALPLALTLYSDVLFTQSPQSHSAAKASSGKQSPLSLSAGLAQSLVKLNKTSHANAFLDSNKPILLGYTKNPDAFWRSMRVKWTVGSINAKHDNNTRYSSPLQPVGAYPIVQGFNGSFSHTGASRYALDFAAPIGTPVLAARGGVVVDIKSDSNQGGDTPEYAKYANYVVILHNDGTTGEYYHLKYQGVVVARGQPVQKGQLIGYTGSTGFSSLPHLHFGIYLARYHGGYQSVPFKLEED